MPRMNPLRATRSNPRPATVEEVESEGVSVSPSPPPASRGGRGTRGRGRGRGRATGRTTRSRASINKTKDKVASETWDATKHRLLWQSAIEKGDDETATQYREIFNTYMTAQVDELTADIRKATENGAHPDNPPPLGSGSSRNAESLASDAPGLAWHANRKRVAPKASEIQRIPLQGARKLSSSFQGNRAQPQESADPQAFGRFPQRRTPRFGDYVPGSMFSSSAGVNRQTSPRGRGTHTLESIMNDVRRERRRGVGDRNMFGSRNLSPTGGGLPAAVPATSEPSVVINLSFPGIKSASGLGL